MIVMVNPSVPTKKVFISYSKKDVEAKNELLKHLRPLGDSGRIDAWDEERITPGDELMSELTKALDEAEIAVLIVTADYLDSSRCKSVQMPTILSAQASRGLRIVPILWSACLWELNGWLARLKFLPHDLKPVDQAVSPAHMAQTLTDLAKEINRLLSCNKTAPPPPEPVVAASPSVRPASFTAAPPPQQPEPTIAASGAYVVELKTDTSSVDILELVERMKKQEPRSWLWSGDAFKSLIPGRGDRNHSPERVLRVAWEPETVVVEMSPVGFASGQQLTAVKSRLVRSLSRKSSKLYLYYPFGKSQPHCYEIDVRFGSQVSVLITDISAALPDLERSPMLQLIWSGVGNQSGLFSE